MRCACVQRGRLLPNKVRRFPGRTDDSSAGTVPDGSLQVIHDFHDHRISGETLKGRKGESTIVMQVLPRSETAFYNHDTLEPAAEQCQTPVQT